MTQVNDILKCEVCGNIIEIVKSGGDRLYCCGKLMTKIEEKNGPEGQEKHLPVVEKNNSKITVRVGSIPHPMEDDHYIQWIEIVFVDRIERVFLNSTDEPIAEFTVLDEEKVVGVRAYCNIHGLWVKK